MFVLRLVLNGFGRTLQTFLRSRVATSATEFAFVAPMMIVLLGGAYEVNNYVQADRHVSRAARLMAEFIAASVQSSGNLDASIPTTAVLTTIINMPEIWPPNGASNTGYGTGHWQDYSQVVIRLVRYTPTVSGCVIGCTYTPKVYWVSRTADIGIGVNDVRAACSLSSTGQAISSQNTASATGATPAALNGMMTQLASSQYAPEDQVVVTFYYVYWPLFGSRFLPGITLGRTGTSNAAASSTITMADTTSNSATTSVCP